MMWSSNPMQIIQQFNRFKQQYTGNPQEDVQRLLTSGQMTQEQLNRLQMMASEFQSLLMSK